ncbi:chemotaxis protein CheW [Halorussus sp. MSC15.2]|uniref:chemotaxis protein CheW n=1 Tax=Halorussus sp. MSC15.2 TaxID=2283638 RepID=UPI0013D5A8F9|nr:chemotaxis protein CheW [Halorussus sp. MSC15.2]NEU58457.1 purine-binding chemotaxis protein CheW [Halorussus sp. MSC15.2]
MSAAESDAGADGESLTVLEFAFGSQRYCMRIERVVEIVRKGSVTPLPNTPPHVEGVMDLRGETTRLVDPTRLLDVDEDGAKEMVLVLESGDEGPVGWLVGDVHRVRRVTTDDLDETVGSGQIKGVFTDGDHVVWIDPDDALSSR